MKDRLVITPILDLESQLQDGSASIDLRLGSTFKVPRRSQIPVLDPVQSADYEKYKTEQVEEIHVEPGDAFVLHPQQFALGITLEWVHLPKNLAAFITGRSRWGRDGLIIETAAGVQPGYFGNLTLELTNVGEIPILLYPGLSYAQIFIYEVDQTADGAGEISMFLGTTKPIGGEVDQSELARIKRLKEVRRNT